MISPLNVKTLTAPTILMFFDNCPTLVSCQTQTSVDYILATEGLVQSKNCLGADVLMKLLKNYCRETEMHINVGVVGKFRPAVHRHSFGCILMMLVYASLNCLFDY